MRTDIVLTVSESKRLIAKGVANFSIVKKALKKGMVVIATGTTNSYIVEEILGKPIEKHNYTSGVVLPAREKRALTQKIPDVVLRDGVLVEGLNRFNAPKEMKDGDVYIKGCNALNYKSRIAGILIGHSEGGTIGAVLGDIYGKRINLVLPVGLEKNVYEDINRVSRILQEDAEYLRETPRLLPVTGEIITEIEALEILTGVKALQIAGGGVGGAEGAVRLLIDGDMEKIKKAMELVESIQGEPAFL
jgi:hypothetical protein